MLTFNERLEQISAACEFQQHELDHRITRAKNDYNARCKTVMVKADLAHFLYEEERLVSLGYKIDRTHPPQLNGLGIIGIFLKPEKLIRKELAELEKEIEREYRAELEDTRRRLMDALEADVERYRYEINNIRTRAQQEREEFEYRTRFVEDFDAALDSVTAPQ